MSIDRSLRIQSSLVRHRNVLTRAERVAKLKEDERFSEGMSPLALPKVSHRKAKAGKKKAAPTQTAETAEPTEGK
ncbi:MAG: small basic protein [Planctomycetota bacterium]